MTEAAKIPTSTRPSDFYNGLSQEDRALMCFALNMSLMAMQTKSGRINFTPIDLERVCLTATAHTDIAPAGSFFKDKGRHPPTAATDEAMTAALEKELMAPNPA